MLFVFFCIFLSTFALIKQGEFHHVHSPKEAVPEALLGLSPGVGTPWVSQLRPTTSVLPYGFPDSALAHLRGVVGFELPQSGSWLSPSAPAQGSRWKTRDTDLGISLGAVFVHGWAPFHNRGCRIKDAAFSEGRRNTSSALCHGRSSETDQMVQWHAAFPGQVSPTCAHLSLTGSCQHPLAQQEQEPGQQLSAWRGCG